MNRPKENRQKIIDFVVSCLENGEQRNVILSKCVKKWQKNESWTRTFDRILKISHAEHKSKQDKIKEAIAEVDKQAAIEARKKAIMTADQRKELLTKIANGELKIKKPFVIAGKIMEYPAEPDHTDRRNAIAELNKMGGDYAPVKSTVTLTKVGKDAIEEIYE